jgi:hypothetical protein
MDRILSLRPTLIFFHCLSSAIREREWEWEWEREIVSKAVV